MNDASSHIKQYKAGKIEKAPHISDYPFRYSFCSLVTDIAMYQRMVDAFMEKGFTEEQTEFLFLDNSNSNNGDGYRGLNELSRLAKGEYIVYCHQDLIAIDTQEVLRNKLAELDALDPTWAVAGNAGHDEKARPYRRISDKYGKDQQVGALPAKVVSFDENFFLVKSESRISFSRDLSGFHCYATNLASVAIFCGWSCYVIDFHLEHLGDGKKDQAFYACQDQLGNKIAEFGRPRMIRSPSAKIHVGPQSRIKRALSGLFSK